MSTAHLRHLLLRPRASPRTIAPLARARLHTSVRLLAKDNLMDKDAIDVTSTEYAKTGGGDQSVAHEGAAFDPKNTSPEGQEQAGAEKPVCLSRSSFFCFSLWFSVLRSSFERLTQECRRVRSRIRLMSVQGIKTLVRERRRARSGQRGVPMRRAVGRDSARAVVVGGDRRMASGGGAAHETTQIHGSETRNVQKHNIEATEAQHW